MFKVIAAQGGTIETTESASMPIKVADLLAPIPANWSAIASSPYLPTVTGIYDGGPIHMQDKQYTKGKIITQSAVGLLQYPLEIAMPTQLKVNDLLYWQSHTADNGFYTGDSSFCTLGGCALGPA